MSKVNSVPVPKLTLWKVVICAAVLVMAAAAVPGTDAVYAEVRYYIEQDWPAFEFDVDGTLVWPLYDNRFTPPDIFLGTRSKYTTDKYRKGYKWMLIGKEDMDSIDAAYNKARESDNNVIRRAYDAGYATFVATDVQEYELEIGPINPPGTSYEWKSYFYTSDLYSKMFQSLSDEECDLINENILHGYIWPLSVIEARGLENSKNYDPSYKYAHYVFLRDNAEDGEFPPYVDGFGRIHEGRTEPLTGNVAFGVRPAFFMDLFQIEGYLSGPESKVSGEVGPDALTKTTTHHDYGEWKLTLYPRVSRKHSSHDLSVRFVFEASTEEYVPNDHVTVKYRCAEKGDNEYISAFIIDKDKNVKYYGRVQKVDPSTYPQETDYGVSGEVTINIKDKMEPGDSLYVANEQYNGDYNTDLSSTLKYVAGYVKSGKEPEDPDTPAPEFNYIERRLAPGETYDCGNASWNTTLNITEPGDYTLKGVSRNVRVHIKSADVRVLLEEGLNLNCGADAYQGAATPAITVDVPDSSAGKISFVSKKGSTSYLSGYMAPGILKKGTKTQLVFDTEDPGDPGTINIKGGTRSPGIGGCTETIQFAGGTVNAMGSDGAPDIQKRKTAAIKTSSKTVKRGRKTTVKVTASSRASLTVKAANSKAKAAVRKKYVKITNGKTAKIKFTKKSPKGKYTFKVTSPDTGEYMKTVKTVTIKVK